MNRQLLAKTQDGCNAVAGDSQTLFLGGAPATAVTNFTLTGTPQKPVMLGVLNIMSTQSGVINDIKIAGQSVFTSDKPCAIELFYYLATSIRERYCGVTMGAGLDVFIDGKLNSSGDVAFAWAVDPVEKALEKRDQAPFYDWIFGLDQADIGALSTGTLSAVSVRPCSLGELMLFGTDTNQSDVFVTSVKVGGDELLTGDGNQAIPLSAFLPNQQNDSGLDLNYKIGSNVPVSITIQNRHATVAYLVSGGIYCRAI